MRLRKGQRVTFKESYLSPIWAKEVRKGATGVITNVKTSGECAQEDRAPGIEVSLDEPFRANGGLVERVYFTRGLGGDGICSFDDVAKIFLYYCDVDAITKKALNS
jgi:hypothetical protein